jgi:hypothetical protein
VSSCGGDRDVVGCDEVAFADQRERGEGAGETDDGADQEDLVEAAENPARGAGDQTTQGLGWR